MQSAKAVDAGEWNRVQLAPGPDIRGLKRARNDHDQIED
jgi:hypothetical protein